MSKDLNNCAFIGRLGQDVDLRQTASGSPVANLSIACGDDYKDKQGQKVERTEWVRAVAFGKLADIMAKYLHKGSKVYVSGKMVTRKWTDQSGADRYTTEINISDMQMLDSAPSQQQQGQQQPQQQQTQPAASQPAQQHAGGAQQAAQDSFDDNAIPF